MMYSIKFQKLEFSVQRNTGISEVPKAESIVRTDCPDYEPVIKDYTWATKSQDDAEN